MISNIAQSSQIAGVMMSVTVLLSSYSSFADEHASTLAVNASAPHLVPERERLSVMHSEIDKSLKELRDVTDKFSEINRHIVKHGIPEKMLEHQHVVQLVGMMIGIRKMEADLKNSSPPAPLAEQHMRLRKAMAAARFEIVATYDFHRQALSGPKHFESDINMEGLKALADHSTKRLLELANT
ncbi:hypothetical protein VPH49_24230 [Pseudomonas luteola]|uniref:hypothetical protein n=1 Tax=Pseudomonas luteola TaxID=47886 RepID=UPI003A896EB5